MKYDIVITTDRTMMSNHHGKEFIGFMATGPAMFLPEWLWMWLCCPKPKVMPDGRPIEAPYGLRKIEAKLIDAGFNAAIIDPDYLSKYLDSAKILMIGHHDFFAFGPPSSEWWLITNREPVNRKSFIKLMESREIRKAKERDLKIVVGGPAAWQWLWEPELWSKWGIDVVIDGEAENIVVEVVKKIFEGKEVPKYIWISPYESPKIEDIPIIKGASVNGLIEIMRGCPRGCKFCSVTLRPLRFIPLDMIEKEIMVNVKNGVVHGILHSEDVLLYGAKGVIPREEPLFRLHEVVLKYYKTLAWSHASLAAIVTAERNGKIVSKLCELIYSKCEQDYMGVEVGIETGSPRLAKIIMPSKAAPFKADEYPEIVEEAFKIMHENNIIPAATFILGFPEEKPDDVVKTVELLERLKNYRSVIVPMFFVPMGALKASKDSVTKVKVTREHVEAMKTALNHTLYWADDIMKRYYMKGPKYFLARTLLKTFIFFVKMASKRAQKQIENFTEKELCVQYD
ncbi:MAG: radical SAM protein [Desulfurococcales archaeon ex4484_42]|nr:MAG: radical SAM protein [Desulfurococcales archaeon ex4484_42]